MAATPQLSADESLGPVVTAQPAASSLGPDESLGPAVSPDVVMIGGKPVNLKTGKGAAQVQAPQPQPQKESVSGALFHSPDDTPDIRNKREVALPGSFTLTPTNAPDKTPSGQASLSQSVDAANRAVAPLVGATVAPELLPEEMAGVVGAAARSVASGAGAGAGSLAAGKSPKQAAKDAAIYGGGAAAGELVGAGIKAAAPLIEKTGQALGIGRDAVDSLTRAVKPTGKLKRNFEDSAERALPRLVAAHQADPIKTLGDLAETAQTEANKVWDNEIVPQIEKFKDEVISGKPVADAVRQGVLPGEKDLFEGASDAAENLASKFEGSMTLKQASDRLQALNRQTQKLYTMDPASRYAATAGHPSLEAMEDAAGELRQQIYSKLESLGEKDPAGLRKTYGALKNVGRAAENRAAIVGRQNPINLTQILSAAGGADVAAGALFGGHPLAALAGAVPIVISTIAKRLNAPESLIASALDESGVWPKVLDAATKAARATGTAVKTAAPVASKVGTAVAQSSSQE